MQGILLFIHRFCRIFPEGLGQRPMETIKERYGMNTNVQSERTKAGEDSEALRHASTASSYGRHT